MLLPHLLRILWPLVIGFMILIVVSVVFSAILIPGFGALKSHPWSRRFIEWAPFVYPLICWALFSYAARHDRGVVASLRASGAAASAPAVVLEVRDRGIELGVDPVLTVRVRVTPDGAEPFDSEVAYVPSRLDMGRVREGTNLRVRYDPRDRSRLAVEAITSVSFP